MKSGSLQMFTHTGYISVIEGRTLTFVVRNFCFVTHLRCSVLRLRRLCSCLPRRLYNYCFGCWWYTFIRSRWYFWPDYCHKTLKIRRDALLLTCKDFGVLQPPIYRSPISTSIPGTPNPFVSISSTYWSPETCTTVVSWDLVSLLGIFVLHAVTSSDCHSALQYSGLASALIFFLLGSFLVLSPHRDDIFRRYFELTALRSALVITFGLRRSTSWGQWHLRK